MIPEDYTIRHNDTISELFGSRRIGFYNQPAYKQHPVYKKFQEKIREIHGFCENNDIPIAECTKLIVTVFGFDWDMVPYGRFEEIFQFVKNNGQFRYRWIDPDYHKKLESIGYYG